MQGGYYEAMATDVDLENKVLHCQYPKAVEGTGREHNFDLPYDVLVVGVGPCSLSCLSALSIQLLPDSMSLLWGLVPLICLTQSCQMSGGSGCSCTLFMRLHDAMHHRGFMDSNWGKVRALSHHLLMTAMHGVTPPLPMASVHQMFGSERS